MKVAYIYFYFFIKVTRGIVTPIKRLKIGAKTTNRLR